MHMPRVRYIVIVVEVEAGLTHHNNAWQFVQSCIALLLFPDHILNIYLLAALPSVVRATSQFEYVKFIGNN